jgi:hypothetical protein
MEKSKIMFEYLLQLILTLSQNDENFNTGLCISQDTSSVYNSVTN